MNEEALKKQAHDYVMNHYDSEGYGTCLGKLEENAYIAGYKVAMQEMSEEQEQSSEDLDEAATKYLDDVFGSGQHLPFYLTLFKAGAEWQKGRMMKDDSPIGIAPWVAKED